MKVSVVMFRPNAISVGSPFTKSAKATREASSAASVSALVG
jgi:hypothetical protein